MPSCRYWNLGSLGPESNEELMAKKMAAQKAKEYGIRVGELVKANRRPREPMKKEMSKHDRAKQFAKTVPLPTKRADTKATTQAAANAADDAEEFRPMPVEPIQRRDSVRSLMTRHDTNTKSIADIKAEVRMWELEDQGVDAAPRSLPRARRKSPTGRAQKESSPSPHPERELQPSPVNTASPARPPEAEQESTAAVDEQREVVDDTLGVALPMPREGAVEVA